MNPREKLIDLILPVFKSIFPRFERGDLLFFGDRADVVSPAPRKYSLDADENMVYNIKSSSANGTPLFREAASCGGYLNMTLSDEAVSSLADEFIAGRVPGDIPGAFRLGSDGELLVRLIPLSRTDGGVFPPEDPDIRRAVLFSMFAETKESGSRAAGLIRRALSKDRMARACGKRLIPGKAALVMALFLEEKVYQKV